MTDAAVAQPVAEPGTGAGAPRAQLTGISKQFGATKALTDVSLDLLPGEVHALVGENGAGKSTLVKILAGNHQPDAGEIRLDGELTHIAGPAQARALGRDGHDRLARDAPRGRGAVPRAGRHDGRRRAGARPVDGGPAAHRDR